jgi:mRNA-degrading endonuclease RelE of RelBE toxin-antitoxin system
MQITLSRKARKQYDKLNEPVKGRVKAALNDLSKNPPRGDIKSLEGATDFVPASVIIEYYSIAWRA